MTTAFILGKDVDRCVEFSVRCDRAWLAADLTALYIFALETTEKETDVLASLTLIEELAEHLDTGDHGLL